MSISQQGETYLAAYPRSPHPDRPILTAPSLPPHPYRPICRLLPLVSLGRQGDAREFPQPGQQALGRSLSQEELHDEQEMT